jgi:hypothetical protein
MARDYKKEYANYHSKPAAKKQRARNNKANRKAGTYGNGDGKDIAHKDNNTHNNSKSNLVKQSPSKNRSFKRTKTARRK